MGRNESFNHAGNVVFARIAGGIGAYVGQQWIFYSSALFAGGTIASAWVIRDEDIDNDAARGADEGNGHHLAGFGDLVRDRRILTFTAAVLLFHLANAAMLPLVGELLSNGKPQGASLYMAACIIAAQAVMIPVALFTGRYADIWGRKPLFLIGFGVLALRVVAAVAAVGFVFFACCMPETKEASPEEAAVPR